jgi:arylsulfatase A-like enzyme
LLLLLFTSFLLVTSGTSIRFDRPNVLILILDAARPDHLGFYGYKRPTTPEIDRICKDSLVFTNASTVAPYTLASTASLFTSLYADTHSVVDPENRLSEKIPTMAEAFRKVGYQTVMVANNPFFTPTFGLDRGFDTHVEEESYGTNRAETVTNRVVAELDKVKGVFFCYVHYLRPHDPYDSPPDIHAAFDRSRKPRSYDLGGMDQGAVPIVSDEVNDIIDDYDAGLRTVDREVRRIFQYLRSSGRLKNTIVAILSDHGEAFGEHGRMLHSSTVHEEMIRIPMILYYSVAVKAGKNENLAQNVDIFPTLADLAKIPLPDFVQGQSLLGKAREYSFSRTNGYTPVFSVSSRDSKLIRDSQKKSAQFYDLKKDPLEKAPLRRSGVSGENAAQFHELESVFARWIESCAANHQGSTKLRNLHQDLLSRLKSVGYLQ